MGCASSTNVASIDELELQLDHGHLFRPKRSEKHISASKQVDTAELSHVLPNELTDDVSTDFSTDEPVRKWSAASDDGDDSDTDSFSNVSIQIHVPPHLQSDVKEEPILTDFREPSLAECSWNMPSLRSRAKDLPVGTMVAPDRELHDQYMKKLDNYLKVISTTPRRLETQVQVKRMMSGMSPRSAEVGTRKRKDALKSLSLF